MRRVQHPVDVPVHDGLGFCHGQRGGIFGSQAVELALLFQEVNDAGVAVVAADAELLTHVHAVDLLAQRLVRGVVEIQAADQVFAADGMCVRLCYCLKTRPNGEQIRIADLMFPFMPIVNIHKIPLCFLFHCLQF